MKIKAVITITAVLAASLAFSEEESKPERHGKAKGGKDASAIFQAIDTNGDGKITAKELSESRRFRDSSPRKVGAAFADKDLNGDGAISGQEFTRTFGNARKGGWDTEAGGKGRRKGGKGGKKKGKGGRRSAGGGSGP